MWRGVFLILLSEGHWCVCCEARCGKAIQEAALAAASEEHLLGCLRCPAARGVGPSLSVCRRCSGRLRNSNLPREVLRPCWVMLARESFLRWVLSTFAAPDKLEPVCLWDWELSRGRKGRRRDRSKAREGGKNQTLLWFSHMVIIYFLTAIWKACTAGGLALPTVFRGHFGFLCFPGACRRKDARSLWAKGLLRGPWALPCSRLSTVPGRSPGRATWCKALCRAGRLTRTTAHSLPRASASCISWNNAVRHSHAPLLKKKGGLLDSFTFLIRHKRAKQC